MPTGPDAIHTTAAELDAIAHRAARQARLLPADTEPNHANAIREAANAADAAANELRRALLDHPQQRLHVDGKPMQPDRAARYADNATTAERDGRTADAETWKAHLANVIEDTASHRTPSERIDLYHAELRAAERRAATDPYRI